VVGGPLSGHDPVNHRTVPTIAPITIPPAKSKRKIVAKVSNDMQHLAPHNHYMAESRGPCREGRQSRFEYSVCLNGCDNLIELSTLTIFSIIFEDYTRRSAAPIFLQSNGGPSMQLSQPLNLDRNLTTCRALCARYNVVPKTITRWIEAGILPQPMWINKRRYWDLAQLDAFDRDRMKDAQQQQIESAA
jgi:hypothetical protein